MKTGWRDEHGQALLVVALSLGMIFGILGLTVDVGWAYYRKQAAQTAAEAAAVAAVKSAMSLSATFTCGTDVECPSTPTACPAAPISSTLSPSYNNIQIGCYYAQLDGFSAGGSSGTQSVKMAAGTGTPTTVPNVSTSYWVTARVSESTSSLFSGVISGDNSLTASARATAGLINSPLTGCAYLLAPSGVGLNDTAGGSFTSASCAVYVDSSAANAVSISGGGDFKVGSINVVGGISHSGGGSLGSTTLNTGIATFPDPLAAVPEPTPGSCVTGVNWSANPLNLSPGTYCGGINLSGGNPVNMASGVYIMLGGGFKSSASGTLTGNGVMIYNTYDGTHAFAVVNISASGTITLSAPTSGVYQGVLFFEDRSVASGQTDTITGGATMNLVGDLYFKKSQLTVTAGGSSTDVAIVANTLNYTGGGNMTDKNLSGNASAPAAPSLAVIE